MNLFRLAGCCAVFTGYLYHAGWIRMQYPDAGRYPVQGLDVSRHQGAIDWPKLSASGKLSFVYIKASVGGDHADPRFEDNWHGAQEAGLAPGAYHYFTFCKPAGEQASHFLDRLARVRGPMLPPAVDLEFAGNCAARPAPAVLARELRAFSDRLYRALGVRPVFYVTGSFWERYHAAVPAGADLWVRSVFLRPERGFPEAWRFWQFAERARLPGIRGPVDLDVFCGSEDDWRRFLRERIRLQPDDSPGVRI